MTDASRSIDTTCFDAIDANMGVLATRVSNVSKTLEEPPHY
jgi:hypothetical protein